MDINGIALYRKVRPHLNKYLNQTLQKYFLPPFSRSLHHINSWTIQLGITRRHSHTYYGQKVKVQRVIPHPQYNLDVIHDNDIALFQVRTTIKYIYNLKLNRYYIYSN